MESKMIGQSITFTRTSTDLAVSKTSQLRQEYLAYQQWFKVQAASIRQLLHKQAVVLAEAILNNETRVYFSLPDQVLCPFTEKVIETIELPIANRRQKIGNFLDRLTNTKLQIELCERLSELEKSPDKGISISARLLRYAISEYMIHDLLPSGRSVVYAIPENDDIPNQPVNKQALSAFKASIHSIPKSVETQPVTESFDPASSYVNAALDFFMPQWVAFDSQQNLLIKDIQLAEAYISSMQHYLAVLDTAITIAPYMIADDIYLQKRYGIQGQLVNQGRALARYETNAIITAIQKRAAEHNLDRGLNLKVPYFDDRKFTIESYSFMIIPAGWIMFIPAFAVLASREQQFKVVQDKTLSFATRKHLIAELHDLELAFMR
jgi:hypothetical protein